MVSKLKIFNTELEMRGKTHIQHNFQSEEILETY